MPETTISRNSATTTLPAPSPSSVPLAQLYQTVVLWYVVALLYLYPYGLALSPEVNLRATDVVALVPLAIGGAAVLLRGRIRIARTLWIVIGLFVLLEMYAPIVGAVGYRRPTDVVSAIRMAMLWLPMLLLTMLARPQDSLTFERRLARVLGWALWLNLIYAVLQVCFVIGLVPRWILVTAWLEPYVVDRAYDIIQGIRPAGFFARSTALSGFGVVCLCFFYARFVSSGQRRDLFYAVLAIGVVVLTTSRAAYAAAAAILFAGWWHLSSNRKITLLILLVVATIGMLVAVDRTVGLEVAFNRFQRLAESGLLEDASFGARIYDIWPAAIAAARDFRLGTLIQSPRALPVIDSGYLTYYLQGKWPFVVALAVLVVGHWYVGLRAFFGPRHYRFGVMALFLAIFLTIALIISNPLRSPLVIVFIVFAFWRIDAERRSVLARVADRAEKTGFDGAAPPRPPVAGDGTVLA
jgi:hypothetical protein